MSIKSNSILTICDEIKYNYFLLKRMIGEPFPFSLVKLFDPDY